MDPLAMQPQGRALMAYFRGDSDAQLVIHRDDGMVESMPAGHFFRGPSEFSEIERAAMDLCHGNILDAGAGTGIHSLVLQEKGLTVTAIDIDPEAVEIMRARGVTNAQCQNLLDRQAGEFDTVLLMGHGIGMVETMAGLDQFLELVHRLLAESGQVLLDSQDVRKTEDPRHLAYHEANRRAGRYIGEVRLKLGFQGSIGPLCGWLHVDAETLAARAKLQQLTCQVVRQEESGHYLARLSSE